MEKISFIYNQTVHTNAFRVTSFTENKRKILAYRLKHTKIFHHFSSQKNVNETERRHIFLDKSIHCNVHQRGHF